MNISVEQIFYFIELLKTLSDYDFSDYSEKSFARRIERVLIDCRIEFDELIEKIKVDAPFREKVVKLITVNTTELFRDPPIWQLLRYRILPRLDSQNKINIWHAGCSTGQEVYSMLILLSELGMLDKANVFATDINTDVLDVARKGVYKYRHNIEYLNNFNKVIRENPYNYEEYTEVPYSLYFDIDKIKDSITMKPLLTRKPIFMKHDLVSDGNIFQTKFDIIICRNVLIYFNTRLQNKTFEMFHQSLFKDGILILGVHESMLGPIANKFRKKGKFYSKADF